MDFFTVEQTPQELTLDHAGDPTLGHCLRPIELILKSIREDDTEEEVAKLMYYQLASFDKWGSIDYFEALDSVDSDTAKFIPHLTDEYGRVDPYNELLSSELEWFNCTGPVALIHMIKVQPGWHRRGLGRALLAHALRYQMEGYSHAIILPYPLQYGSERPDDPVECKTWLDSNGYHFQGSEQDCTQVLVNLYRSLGFRELPAPLDSVCMGLSFAYNYDELWSKAITAVTEARRASPVLT